MNIIHNAVLVEVRQSDKAQMYRFGPGVTDVMWLSGIDRNPKAMPGDSGDLVWHSTRSRGWYSFVILNK